MKSIEIKFNEALAALDKAGKRAKFEEKKKAGSPIEVQLNCAEAILKESRIIPKHNGADDNFVEGSPFNNEHSFSEGYVAEADNKDVFGEGDRILMESMNYPPHHPLAGQRITEADKRKLTGGLPAEVAKLSEAKQRTYKEARMFGISEADAFRLTNII
jgi:hypothetical protein